MSKLYGSIKGSAAGEATRRAHTQITGHIRGWDVGVKVKGHHDKHGDFFHVYASHGSNGKGSDVFLGTVRLSATDGSIQFCQEGQGK